MTDSFWSNLAGIITATGLLVTAVFTFWTHQKVGKVEVVVEKVQAQTDGMNRAMVDAAKKETKADMMETITAVTPPPAPLPLIVAPEAKQDEIVKWVSQGIAQGIVMEKTRRATEGNGPKAPS